MKRFLSSLLLAAPVALVFLACADQRGYGDSYSSQTAYCSQYATCGTCTPVNGCGWCYTADAGGMCAADPNECAGSSEFLWTWNADGCREGADASVVPLDGGAHEGATEAAADGHGG
jgi:hypothetical protein